MRGARSCRGAGHNHHQAACACFKQARGRHAEQAGGELFGCFTKQCSMQDIMVQMQDGMQARTPPQHTGRNISRLENVHHHMTLAHAPATTDNNSVKLTDQPL